MAGNGTAPYFEQIYDRYAAVMYGCILKIVREKKSADAVLRITFAELYTANAYTAAGMPDAVWFIKFAMQKAFQFLKENNPSSYSNAINEINTAAFHH